MHARIWLAALVLASVGISSTKAQDARPMPKAEGKAEGIARTREIAVDVRFASVSEAVVETLAERWALRFAGQANSVAPAWIKAVVDKKQAVIDDKQFDELLAVLHSDRRSSIMQSPKLTLASGQQAALQVGEEQSFLTGIDVKVDEEVIMHPKQTKIFLGHRHVLRPTLERDGVTVSLEVAVELSQLAGPVALTPLQLPLPSKKGQPEVFQIFLQQPAVAKLTLDNTFKIPDRKTQVAHLGRILTETRTEQGAPVLSRVPYVGRLFRNVGYGREAQDVIVFLTPRIQE
jgi:type II secretory pathway component GspD/PulD (secretin)